MKPIIKAEKLSKQYYIGVRESSPTTLRGKLFGGSRALFKNLRRNRHSPGEVLWAVKDASFEVYPGEVVGIIGRNGSGKSTLLKILSRITEPTEGRARIYGRVGSLLEVGTGFHPELTGRENVYLNGTILGMSREKIKRKFDEIVAFAEVEKFIDTPVKHYSSGMYVRLAFAVAAHVEPEVLLVDEVLAVGDEAFQRKCIQKVSKLRQQGHTILLVSHDLNTVRGVCNRAAWFLNGRLNEIGETEHVAKLYREYMLSVEEATASNDAPVPLAAKKLAEVQETGTRITSVKLLNHKGTETTKFQTGERMRVVARYESARLIKRPSFGVGIVRQEGNIHCHGCTTGADGIRLTPFQGEGEFELEYESLDLLPGTYKVTVGVWEQDGNIQLDSYLDAAFFEVRSSLSDHGLFHLRHRWKP